MVYVNAPLGLFACLIRLLQSVIRGLWTLSRLDVSTMSRAYEATDRGMISRVKITISHNNKRTVSTIPIRYERIESLTGGVERGTEKIEGTHQMIF